VRWFLVPFILFLISCQGNPDESVPVNGKPVTRLDSLNQQIIDNPKEAKFFVERATYFEEHGELVRATEDLDRAKVIQPENCSLYAQKARILIKLKNYRGVIGELDKCLGLFPDNVEGNLVMTELLLRSEKFDEALDYADKVLKVDVYNAEAYYLKGMIFKTARDTSRAVSSFLTATEQDNTHYESYLQLGLLYSIAGDELAISFYDNAIRIRPNSKEALYNKGKFLQDQNRSREALKTYSEILALDSADAQAHYNRGFVYLTQLEVLDTAQMEFQQSLKSIPNWTDAVYNVGLTYELMGNKDEALKYYRNALDLDPTHTLSAKGLTRLGV
jgi:tetratricopeptide (TPR) repeat protein